MGLFDKIKDALFEVEYVEVEDKPKKEKKEKKKDKVVEETNEEKPIAKKIVLPGRREDKIEKLQEEELVNQDFEIRPKDETVKEGYDFNNTPFKYMDDNDFKVDEEPRIIDNIDDVEVLSDTETGPISPSVPDPILNEPLPSLEVNTAYSGVSPIDNVDNYASITSSYKSKPKESRPYGMDPSYQVSIREYGSYDNKDEKSYFKPSPIISPIYGILDKNYKKDDVVAKKENRTTTSYSRSRVNVDEVRNKAYGIRDKETTVEELIAPEVQEEENLLVDLSDEKEKPEVKEITVGDAMEYFQDLGLEYNVDYVDATNKKDAKKKTEELEEEIPEVKEEIVEKLEEEKKPKKVEVVKEEKKADKTEDTISDDDNLFDLIDSMYKES
ncbi:MAG: hypothetical protein IJG68_04785 [Bacilli bacterium]|nr:hypothetical protein [Bacilli bacterium]